MTNDWHADSDLLREELAAYSLGALPDADAERLERHLEGCASCRSRVRCSTAPEITLTAGSSQRTPPASLRENLMATVRAEAAPEPDVRPAKPTSERGSWWQGLGGLVRRPAVGMAVMIVLVVGLGAGYLLAGGSNTADAPTFTKATAPPGSTVTDVSGTLERDGETTTLHVQSLPKIARDEVYEVWVRRGGAMEPRSVFVLNRDGSAEAAVPGSLAGADAVLVTREPHGGSAQPTTPAVLQASLE